MNLKSLFKGMTWLDWLEEGLTLVIVFMNILIIYFAGDNLTSLFIINSFYILSFINIILCLLCGIHVLLQYSKNSDKKVLLKPSQQPYSLLSFFKKNTTSSTESTIKWSVLQYDLWTLYTLIVNVLIRMLLAYILYDFFDQASFFLLCEPLFSMLNITLSPLFRCKYLGEHKRHSRPFYMPTFRDTLTDTSKEFSGISKAMSGNESTRKNKRNMNRRLRNKRNKKRK